MKNHSLEHLTALIGVLLLLFGLAFLILPHHLGSLNVQLPRVTTLLLGILFRLTAALSLVSIAIPFQRRSFSTLYAVLTICLLLLAWLYLSEERLIGTSLLVALAFLIPVTLIITERNTTNAISLPVAFIGWLNLAIGLALLAWTSMPMAENYRPIVFLRPYFGAFFVVSAWLGGLVSLRAAWADKRLMGYILALPWLGGGMLAALQHDLLALIPALSLALSLIVLPALPWEQLKLPADDRFAKRTIALVVSVQSALLLVIAFLLENTNPTQVSSLSGWGIWTFDLRKAVFMLLLSTEAMLAYSLTSMLLVLNKQKQTLASPSPLSSVSVPAQKPVPAWLFQKWFSWLRPKSTALSHGQAFLQRIMLLEEQLANERRRSTQLLLLAELSQQLEHPLDIPVASQLAVNHLQRALNCDRVVLYLHESERRELAALAAAGPRINLLSPSYRQNVNLGVLGRAARLRKTQIVNNALQDRDFIRLSDEDETRSVIVVPMIDHGHLKAILEISDRRVNAFNSLDIQAAEAIAAELLRAWERSEYRQRLTELIQAGISLTAQSDPQTTLQEVARLARQTLRARFTFVALLDQDGNLPRTAWAGHAPRLLRSLQQSLENEPLIQAALRARHPFRIRDLRRYKRASHLEIDFPILRSMIAVPIRLHRLSVGAMLAFGKHGEIFFTENDESLAGLLSYQAAAAIESAWLSHELRTNLLSTIQLHQLSFQIIQAQELNDAVRQVAEAAQKVCSAKASGIVLFTPQGEIEAEAQLNANGSHVVPAHPMDLIHRSMESGQSIFLSSANDTILICFPLKTPRRTYGSLWLELPEQDVSRFSTNLQTLANQAAIALERTILLVELRQQARQIETAYRELENTYDQTLAALMAALDARDRETEGHSSRVAQIACLLGRRLGLSPAQLKALERGSLLHDLGKIGISDTILHKPALLSAEEWKIMRLHPEIGARIVERIPFLQDALAVIRYHQERWDGSGYPMGLSGKDIPYLARIFAVADAFDALISDRPYRTRIRVEEALDYLREQAGILFDPQVVETLLQLFEEGALDPYLTEQESTKRS